MYFPLVLMVTKLCSIVNNLEHLIAPIFAFIINFEKLLSISLDNLPPFMAYYECRETRKQKQIWRTTMNHSTSKRTAKALPQIESTILVEGIDKKVIKCTARKAFTVGNSSIKEGETFFLVASARRESRYYVVHFSEGRNTYQCSCGANCCEHEHVKGIREYVIKNVVTPAKAKAAKSVDKKTAQVEVIAPSVPLTSAEWKAIMKRDRARQKAEKAADMAKIEEARAQGRKEASIA
jgi:hypothetical protein